MMRRDGTYTVYLVQHSYPDYREGAYVESDVGHFLFGRLSFEEKKGAKGDRYRALLKPMNECWQRTGVNGFLDLPAAATALVAVDELEPAPGEREMPTFRVVRRTISQRTAVVL